MTGEYAYVGPALFEMRSFPDTVKLVRERQSWTPIEPREVYCPVNDTWVRLSGEWISGWREGQHFGFRPHWLNRWKIRRAARAWERATLSRESSK